MLEPHGLELAYLAHQVLIYRALRSPQFGRGCRSSVVSRASAALARQKSVQQLGAACTTDPFPENSHELLKI